MRNLQILIPAPATAWSAMATRALDASVAPYLVGDPGADLVDGHAMRVYTVALPSDTTIGVSVGAWGSAGVGLEDGHVCVDTPLLVSGIVAAAAKRARAFVSQRILPKGQVRILLDLRQGGMLRVPVGTQGVLILRMAPA